MPKVTKDVSLSSPLRLPCGLVLKNRLVKAAMTEGLADHHGIVTDDHIRLYDLWSRSGVGMLVTGNVMVDRFHLERAGNVVIDGPQSEVRMAGLRQYAAAAQQNDTACFVQLSHSGRQTQTSINPHPKSASDVKLSLPGGLYARPDPLSENEIEVLIGKFSLAAKACQEAGFSGVQIHAAHGYLLSQFLSPKTNQRTDRWGGNLENRARLLMEVVAEVRKVTGDDFGVSVKLNSADFQKGGFEFEDCLQVIGWLNRLNIDMLEISGGTYEQPKMIGLDGAIEPMHAYKSDSSQQREAYFLRYATAMQKVAAMPLMITGGFRSRSVMDAALSEGELDLIGLARPMVPYPHCTAELLAGDRDSLPDPKDFTPTSWLLKPDSRIKLIKLMHGLGVMGWYYQKILEMGAGHMPDLGESLFHALRSHMGRDKRQGAAYVNQLKRQQRAES